MHGKTFFDSNILLYLLSRSDPKAAETRALLEAGGCISVQVLNEIVNVARRKARLDWQSVQAILRLVQEYSEVPHPVTLATHNAALVLAQRYGYTIYDSLLLASALEQGCDTFFSEDMQDGHTIEGLTIRNPFRKPQ